MQIEVKAAVSHAPGEPARIETLRLAAPGPGEVQVRLQAAGLCHSDLMVLEGGFPEVDGGRPFRYPTVLGHEGAGVVESCGPGVSGFEPGDPVLLFAAPHCGECPLCRSGRTNVCTHTFVHLQNPAARFSRNGEPVSQFCGLGTFAERTVVPAELLVRIRPEMPADRACYIGCGVTTGVGAAVFSAEVRAGSSVAVFGLGGVGLNVIQGARLAGATTIIGIDRNPAREAIARKLGATHFLLATPNSNPVEAVQALTAGGADYSFECVGNLQLIRQALECTHFAWGLSLIVGAAPAGKEVATLPFNLMMGRRWGGSWLGGARPRDLGKLIDWYLEGQLNLDDLITHRFRLDEINRGFELMKSGESIRSVLTL